MEKILEVASSKDQNEIDIWMANHYLNILPIRLEIIIEQLEKLKETQMVDALNAYHKSMLEELKEKTNQDSFLIKNKLLGDENFSLIGVFDGHGPQGHFVSNLLKLFFSEYFTKMDLYKL